MMMGRRIARRRRLGLVLAWAATLEVVLVCGPDWRPW